LTPGIFTSQGSLWMWPLLPYSNDLQ